MINMAQESETARRQCGCHRGFLKVRMPSLFEPVREKSTIWIPTRSDTIRAVQSQKIVRGSKFWIYKVEELNYQCSEIDKQYICYNICMLNSVGICYMIAIYRWHLICGQNAMHCWYML